MSNTIHFRVLRKSNFHSNTNNFFWFFFILSFQNSSSTTTIYLFLTLYCTGYSLKCVIFSWNCVACYGSRCVSFYRWVLLLAYRYLSIDNSLFFLFELVVHFFFCFIKCSTLRTTLFLCIHYDLNFYTRKTHNSLYFRCFCRICHY